MKLANASQVQFFLQTNINYLLTLVRKAGSEVLRYYKNKDLEIEFKEDFTPITLADKKANKILCDGLAQFDFSIISEENLLQPWQVRKNRQNLWLIDPLDGTRAFINCEDEFTINLALLHDKTPIFGIVYAPVLDEMCWNLANRVYWQKGARVQELAKPSKCSIPRVYVSKTSSKNTATQKFLQNLGPHKLIKASSSWKFCNLAKGEAEIYPRFGNTFEWDTAAGHAILLAMGGNVLNATTGAQLTYNKENLQNPYFIASINF